MRNFRPDRPSVRQIGPTRFQFDRPSLPTNRTTSTHYGIPLPPSQDSFSYWPEPTTSPTDRWRWPNRFRVPGFLIGLTIVAVGTSTPELVVSFLSALEGQGDMAVGNVVGSNLFPNVFIILGVCALIRPLPLTRQNIRRDLPVGVAASLVLCAVLADEVLDPTHPARIGRIEELAMLLLYVLSVWTAARAARREQPAEDTPAARPIAGWLMALMIVGGLAALVFGGEIFLHNAVAIARKLGVGRASR